MKEMPPASGSSLEGEALLAALAVAEAEAVLIALDVASALETGLWVRSVNRPFARRPAYVQREAKSTVGRVRIVPKEVRRA